MKIKHSKFKNTGLLYELLVKQITSDLVARKDSPAISILRKYFGGENALVQELGLYRTIQESRGIPTIKADNLISAVLRASKKINLAELKSQKYAMISEIQKSYDLESFFSVPVAEYRTLAATYCLFEAERSNDLIDPQSIVTNKVTLLEHMTSRLQDRKQVEDALIEEFSNSDKDLRLLTFKVLLEKFNDKYANLLPEQKQFLKQFISLGTSRKLKDVVTEEYRKLSEKLTELSKKVSGIEGIMLQEVLKTVSVPPVDGKISDACLVQVLQLQELVHKLQNL